MLTRRTASAPDRFCRPGRPRVGSPWRRLATGPARPAAAGVWVERSSLKDDPGKNTEGDQRKNTVENSAGRMLLAIRAARAGRGEQGGGAVRR
jgi:hypothetical protein